MRRPVSSILFLYALVVSLLAYAYRDIYDLLFIGLINAVLGLVYGYRYKLLWLLLALGLWGTFINAYVVSNTGQIVFSWGWIIIREGVLTATTAIFMRLLSIVGATLFFIGNSTPFELIKSLISELRLPKGIAFSISYAIRLIPLMRKDYEEIRIARLERGYRRIPYLPNDLKTFLLPLLNIAYERAIWAGIAVELKGFRLGKVKYRKIRIDVPEIAVFILLAIQVILPLIF